MHIINESERRRPRKMKKTPVVENALAFWTIKASVPKVLLIACLIEPANSTTAKRKYGINATVKLMYSFSETTRMRIDQRIDVS